MQFPPCPTTRRAHRPQLTLIDYRRTWTVFKRVSRQTGRAFGWARPAPGPCSERLRRTSARNATLGDLLPRTTSIPTGGFLPIPPDSMLAQPMRTLAGWRPRRCPTSRAPRSGMCCTQSSATTSQRSSRPLTYATARGCPGSSSRSSATFCAVAGDHRAWSPHLIGGRRLRRVRGRTATLELSLGALDAAEFRLRRHRRTTAA